MVRLVLDWKLPCSSAVCHNSMLNPPWPLPFSDCDIKPSLFFLLMLLQRGDSSLPTQIVTCMLVVKPILKSGLTAFMPVKLLKLVPLLPFEIDNMSGLFLASHEYASGFILPSLLNFRILSKCWVCYKTVTVSFCLHILILWPQSKEIEGTVWAHLVKVRGSMQHFFPSRHSSRRPISSRVSAFPTPVDSCEMLIQCTIHRCSWANTNCLCRPSPDAKLP